MVPRWSTRCLAAVSALGVILLLAACGVPEGSNVGAEPSRIAAPYMTPPGTPTAVPRATPSAVAETSTRAVAAPSPTAPEPTPAPGTATAAPTGTPSTPNPTATPPSTPTPVAVPSATPAQRPGVTAAAQDASLYPTVLFVYPENGWVACPRTTIQATVIEGTTGDPRAGIMLIVDGLNATGKAEIEYV